MRSQAHVMTIHPTSGPNRRISYRLAGLGGRLVHRPAGVQDIVGEGHDVDLPGIRYLHLQLLPDWLHDGTEDIDHSELAE